MTAQYPVVYSLLLYMWSLKLNLFLYHLHVSRSSSLFELFSYIYIELFNIKPKGKRHSIVYIITIKKLFWLQTLSPLSLTWVNLIFSLTIFFMLSISSVKMEGGIGLTNGDLFYDKPPEGGWERSRGQGTGLDLVLSKRRDSPDAVW